MGEKEEKNVAKVKAERKEKRKKRVRKWKVSATEERRRLERGKGGRRSFEYLLPALLAAPSSAQTLRRCSPSSPTPTRAPGAPSFLTLTPAPFPCHFLCQPCLHPSPLPLSKRPPRPWRAQPQLGLWQGHIPGHKNTTASGRHPSAATLDPLLPTSPFIFPSVLYSRKKHRLWATELWVSVASLPPKSCVALRKSLDLCGPLLHQV